MSVAAKICGITDREALHAAIESGASLIGFGFVPASKRFIEPAQAKALLMRLPHPALCRFVKAPPTAGTNEIVLTALFVDPKDTEIDAVVEALSPFLGLIQLHGAETPERVATIRERTGLPVMKAIAVADEKDLQKVPAYEDVADMLLFDAKLPDGSSGGAGVSFDWTLLTGRKWKRPWLLAGGLCLKNVVQAVQKSGADFVDVSTGVETDGKKDPLKISAFIQVCHEL